MSRNSRTYSGLRTEHTEQSDRTIVNYIAILPNYHVRQWGVEKKSSAVADDAWQEHCNILHITNNTQEDLSLVADYEWPKGSLELLFLRSKGHVTTSILPKLYSVRKYGAVCWHNAGVRHCSRSASLYWQRAVFSTRLMQPLVTSRTV
jgi:hypothetical protein